MEAEIVQDQQALLAQLAQDCEKLDGLVRDLRAVDDELQRLAPEREQHRLLHDACGALEALRGTGGAELFWGAGAAADAGQDQIRSARDRVDAFQQRVSEIDDRRRALLEQIERQQASNYLLEDDLFEAQEEEERRRHEWIVEREIGVLPAAAAPLPWMRGGEDDRRFRKSLAVSLLVSLIFALILPSIVLPLLPASEEPVKVPDRVVRMMMEKRPKPPAPPPVSPMTKPQEQLAKLKPAEQVVPQKPAKPDKQEPVKPSDAGPADVPKPQPEKGLLAFRQELDSLKDSENVANLGLQARIRKSDDNASGPPQRSMLTTSARGSSGGINLAALSKGLNGGSRDGGTGGMAGVQVTRATSAIGGGGGGGASDRPHASGGKASRTDEEIQIVFDRYKASLYRLYNRELRQDPSLRGQMVLRLTIEPDGRVSMCKLHASDMNAPELAAQVVDRVLTINFGAKDVDAITILYPIDFLPAA